MRIAREAVRDGELTIEDVEAAVERVRRKGHGGRPVPAERR